MTHEIELCDAEFGCTCGNRDIDRLVWDSSVKCLKCGRVYDPIENEGIVRIAPELYAACRAMQKWCENYRERYPVWATDATLRRAWESIASALSTVKEGGAA